MMRHNIKPTFMVTAVSSLPRSRADSMISLLSGQYMLIVPAAFKSREIIKKQFCNMEHRNTYLEFS